MSFWNKKAVTFFVLSSITILITPFLTAQVQYFVPNEVSGHWLSTYSVASWGLIYFVAVILTFIFVELISIDLTRNSRSDYPIYIKEQIVQLSQKAKLPVPRIVYDNEVSSLNVGALRSFLYGNIIVFSGEISKLTKEQMEVVVAHEIAHLKMKDPWFTHILLSLLFAIWLLNSTIFVALVVSMFGEDYKLTWFLLVSFFSVFVGRCIARFFYIKHSHAFEYRADVFAVELTSPAHRHHLIDALSQFNEASRLMLTSHHRPEFLNTSTHPTHRARAKALGVVPRVFG